MQIKQTYSAVSAELSLSSLISSLVLLVVIIPPDQNLVSRRSQTLYLPLPATPFTATRGGKGLEEIRPYYYCASETNVGLLPRRSCFINELSTANLSMDYISQSSVSSICSEVSPQISVVTFAAQKSFWHVPFLMRFMECGLISSTVFLWSSELLAILLCARPFPPRVAGKGK